MLDGCPLSTPLKNFAERRLELWEIAGEVHVNILAAILNECRNFLEDTSKEILTWEQANPQKSQAVDQRDIMCLG